MDFSKFYDEQHDYAAFRTDPNKLNEYKIAIQWKAQNLIKTVPNSAVFENVLEVGCAMGVLLNSIADNLSINKRFGIDISFENIEYANKLYPNCSFFCGTVEEILKNRATDFPVNKFDLVILSDIIEHIPNDVDFLKHISGISNFVLLNLPLEKCYNQRNRKYGESDPSGHLRNYNLSDATKLVTSSGFEIVSWHTDNAHFNKQFYKKYRENRLFRVKSKPFFLRIFWSVYYSIDEFVKKFFPNLYMKKYGSNYFALLKSINNY